MSQRRKASIRQTNIVQIESTCRFLADKNTLSHQAKNNILQMLQPSIFAQLARIKCQKVFPANLSSRQKSVFMAVNYPSPMAVPLKKAGKTLDMLPLGEKHWFCGGNRSSAIAMQYLEKNEIIAVPTDTIYGFAGLAQSNEAIEKIYELKGRDKGKPLAITLAGLADIDKWAYADHVPNRLLADLLPGPVTIVLKRKPSLNRALNPGHESVGIRVPRSKFIRHVCKSLRQPLALTSANLSNEPSSLHPDEFSSLWPKLGAIFYDVHKPEMLKESRRIGSTVVDLTRPGEFEILRKGIRFHKDILILQRHGVERMRDEKDEREEEMICRRESNA